ncbi:hypothetical protein QYE76_045214 [Lolium multiflorum]|uniref:Uncharacterized protein n=1 Tax=Lolium multiflorum TaxID=4521 RepID=A0AAD8TKT7_LOLMU|nr:hypothetical protein QYE76_045214 [Lolium multiflorum]
MCQTVWPHIAPSSFMHTATTLSARTYEALPACTVPQCLMAGKHRLSMPPSRGPRLPHPTNQFSLRIPVYLLMPIACLVDWSYDKIFSRFGMRKPRLITSSIVKYATLDRTFNCQNAADQLGYKPIVSLKEGRKITTESYKQFRV